MADNNTASAKTDSTKSDAAKTENLLETRSKEKETLPPSPLHTDHGSTLIAEQVVQKIAGIACREVPGVHAMGSAGRRMLSSITDRIPGSTTNVSNGVQVEKGAVSYTHLTLPTIYSVLSIYRWLLNTATRSLRSPINFAKPSLTLLSTAPALRWLR